MMSSHCAAEILKTDSEQLNMVMDRATKLTMHKVSTSTRWHFAFSAWLLAAWQVDCTIL